MPDLHLAWILLNSSKPEPLDPVRLAAVTKNRAMKILVKPHQIQHAKPTENGHTLEVGRCRLLLYELTETVSDLERQVLRHTGCPEAVHHSNA
jgi:hypothetical protein